MILDIGIMAAILAACEAVSSESNVREHDFEAPVSIDDEEPPPHLSGWKHTIL
jgi:hypothetical protein